MLAKQLCDYDRTKHAQRRGRSLLCGTTSQQTEDDHAAVSWVADCAMQKCAVVYRRWGFRERVRISIRKAWRDGDDEPK
jgi:hypothetical protein